MRGGALALSSYFSSVRESDPFRQGDVLRHYESGAAGPWGVLVTADCDIANAKHGGYFTYVPVIPAAEYLEHYWAAERAEQAISKQVDDVLARIWRAEQRRAAGTIRLTALELDEWIDASDATRIAATLAFQDEKEMRQFSSSIEKYILLRKAKASGGNMEVLSTIWRINGTSDRGSILKSALTQMRSEFFYMPMLPDGSASGFVALLGHPRSIQHGSFHRSVTEMILSGQGQSLVRIGRFADFVRYAVGQQFGYLFSRIGMTDAYESDCEASVDLVVSSQRV